MQYKNKIELPLIVDGIKRSVKAEIYTRKKFGECPKLIMLIIDGKRITPYQQSKINIKWTLNALFMLTYSGPLLDAAIYKENPFLKLIPEASRGSPYHQPVILGLDKVIK